MRWAQAPLINNFFRVHLLSYNIKDPNWKLLLHPWFLLITKYIRPYLCYQPFRFQNINISESFAVYIYKYFRIFCCTVIKLLSLNDKWNSNPMQWALFFSCFLLFCSWQVSTKTKKKRSSTGKLFGKYIYCCPAHLCKYWGGW